MSLSGDYALIGAQGDVINAGSAYIFVRSGTTWTQQQKLTASDAASNDGLGASVSLSGDYALIGAPGFNSDTGSAYIFNATASPPSTPYAWHAKYAKYESAKFWHQLGLRFSPFHRSHFDALLNSLRRCRDGYSQAGPDPLQIHIGNQLATLHGLHSRDQSVEALFEVDDAALFRVVCAL